MAAQFADTALLETQIADTLNAAATWAGAITGNRRSEEAITLARRQACYQVLRAIAGNPQHGYFGELSEYVDVESGAFLPAHSGEIYGIPKIIPFEGSNPRKAIPATPDQIDSWRAETAEKPKFTGGVDGIGIPHDQSDEEGNMSPIACRYSMVAGVFDFTGLSAQIPMMLITDDMADNKLPLELAPAVHKLSVPTLVKPGDAVYQIASLFLPIGKQDLIEIAGGAMKVSPVPTIAQLQKQLSTL